MSRLFAFGLALLGVAIFLAHAFAGPPSPAVQVIFGTGTGGAGTNIFVAWHGGGDVFTAPQGSLNRYVFSAARDSAAGTRNKHAAFDEVAAFQPGDVIDIAAICAGRCSGPVFTWSLAGLEPDTVYYTWLPDPEGFATIVCLSPCRAGSFWLPLENGKLTLTRANFAFGGK